jgi:DNA-binding MarR family transcriptional regulator
MVKSAHSTARIAADGLPRGCTNLKLRQLTRRVSRHYDGIVGSAGLKTTQYSLLAHVIRLGPARPGDLAEAMEMDASTLTRNLQSLIGNGWVEVGPGPDGRSRSVTATAAGRAKHAEAQRAWKKAQLALNARLGEARVVALHALLDDCLATINEAGETIDG